MTELKIEKVDILEDLHKLSDELQEVYIKIALLAKEMLKKQDKESYEEGSFLYDFITSLFSAYLLGCSDKKRRTLVISALELDKTVHPEKIKEIYLSSFYRHSINMLVKVVNSLLTKSDLESLFLENKVISLMD